MSASSAADAALHEQLEAASWPGAAERDVTVVQIVGDTVQGAADSAQDLRTRFELPGDGFMVVLLGKDGHVALRSTRPLTAAALAGTIDAMPMRRAELAARPDPPGLHPTREQLVGAWRLVSIATTSPAGAVADAFFEPGSAGLIVYEASGWMSVDITGPHRVGWPIPESRSAATLEHDMRLKAAAYDSYYAYFGTWDYDQAGSVVTHHVRSSLIPAETGLDYAQQVSVAGNRMTFTGHGRDHGHDVTRTKVWERLSPP